MLTHEEFRGTVKTSHWSRGGIASRSLKGFVAIPFRRAKNSALALRTCSMTKRPVSLDTLMFSER